MDHIEQDSSQGNSSKRPLGSKMAKDNAKKSKANEDAFKMAAQAQQSMAETSAERLTVLETQTFMNLITLPTDHLDSVTSDFLSELKLNVMAKLRGRFPARASTMPPNMPPNMPPRAARTDLPTAVHSEDSSPIDNEEFDSFSPPTQFDSTFLEAHM